ncbi:hypothetical protein [Mobiluncus porci]|uniref:hypothetical protein n=1 Tax=Mobiluncus porci TaxID=2652278 RepID=UPI00389B03F7
MRVARLASTEPTCCRWKNQYRGMDLPCVKWMKVLSQENAVLKRLLAEAELEKAALRELVEGNF